MLFNSIDFAIFLPIIFLLYWAFNKTLNIQNCLLLIASYFFYACWDWRFLGLILFSTSVDYFIGLRIHQGKTLLSKRVWLWSSIVLGLGLLCLFKYYNFFAESFVDALALLGIQVNYGLIQVILPLGISFYTFHGLSYVIDIYRGKVEPERNFINYAVFVCFFPLLVAGPIERATHLLPQIKRQRVFDYKKSVDGLRQILWGLFKKVVIADNCANYSNLVFDNYLDYQGSTLVLGVFFFAIQIYCDFSGYSDIAIGTAKLFGMDLLRNFSFPYFSKSIPEFWRRWHISLTSWFRDYIYIPLGGNRAGVWNKARNIFIVFVISGFWHGANWTFIVWGFLHALYMLPSIFFKRVWTSMLTTFGLVLFAWIFFRSPNLGAAFGFIENMFHLSLFSLPETRPWILVLLVAVFVVIEWVGKENEYAIQKTGFRWYRPIRWSFYILLSFLIFLNLGREVTFIYFQF